MPQAFPPKWRMELLSVSSSQSQVITGNLSAYPRPIYPPARAHLLQGPGQVNCWQNQPANWQIPRPALNQTMTMRLRCKGACAGSSATSKGLPGATPFHPKPGINHHDRQPERCRSNTPRLRTRATPVRDDCCPGRGLPALQKPVRATSAYPARRPKQNGALGTEYKESHAAAAGVGLGATRDSRSSAQAQDRWASQYPPSNCPLISLIR